MDYFYVSSLCQLARYLWLVRLGGWKWNILYGLCLVLCFTFSLPILQYRFDKTEIPTYWKRYVLHWLYSSCEGKGLQLISLDKLEKEWSSAWSKAFHKARREISVLMQPLQYYSLVESVSICHINDILKFECWRISNYSSTAGHQCYLGKCQVGFYIIIATQKTPITLV